MTLSRGAEGALLISTDAIKKPSCLQAMILSDIRCAVAKRCTRKPDPPAQRIARQAGPVAVRVYFAMPSFFMASVFSSFFIIPSAFSSFFMPSVLPIVSGLVILSEEVVVFDMLPAGGAMVWAK